MTHYATFRYNGELIKARIVSGERESILVVLANQIRLRVSRKEVLKYD